MSSLARKLHPARYTAMSSMMAALVGYFVDAAFTQPTIAGLAVTNDGFVLARHSGEIGCNTFIGSDADLRRNWTALLDCAGLTSEERAEADRLFAEKL
jgi:hypothetical protein